MARLSKDAKKGLRKKLNMGDSDIQKIGCALSDKGKYTVVPNRTEGEVREIVYLGLWIRGVVRDGVVVTCLTEWMDFI